MLLFFSNTLYQTGGAADIRADGGTQTDGQGGGVNRLSRKERKGERTPAFSGPPLPPTGSVRLDTQQQIVH